MYKTLKWRFLTKSYNRTPILISVGLRKQICVRNKCQNLICPNFSDDEDSSLGATLGLILVAILICVGIGVGVYFGVAAILNSVKKNRKFLKISFYR